MGVCVCVHLCVSVCQSVCLSVLVYCCVSAKANVHEHNTSMCAYPRVVVSCFIPGKAAGAADTTTSHMQFALQRTIRRDEVAAAVGCDLVEVIQHVGGHVLAKDGHQAPAHAGRHIFASGVCWEAAGNKQAPRVASSGGSGA